MPRLGKFTVLVAGALAASGVLLAASGASACDLQPKNQNPVSVPGVQLTRLAKQVNVTFMAGGVSAQRFYDLVAPLDGVTLGFGNWPQNEVSKFFRKMSTQTGGKAFAAFVDCLTEFYALKRAKTSVPKKNKIDCEKARARPTDGMWLRAQKAAGLKPADLTGERVTAVLTATVLSEKYKDRYKGHCKEVCRHNEPDFFHEHENWLVPALCYALRDRSVISWQVDFWTDTIIKDSIDFAETIGMKDDEAAIVAIAAYRSSFGKNSFKNTVKDIKKGTLSEKDLKLKWNWNEPPPGAKHDSEGLKRWHRFVLWQYYAARKHKFRARSQKFFELYLADHWVLPKRKPDGSPDWKKLDNLSPRYVKAKG